MKLLKYSTYLFLSLAVCSLPACSDDDDYTPGPEVSPDCEQVYFSKENATTLMLPLEGTRTTSLIVTREKTTSALSMPVNIISKDDKLTIPSTVEFAAGSSTAELEIDLSTDAEPGTEYSFELELTGEQIDPYSILDGASKFFGSVIIEKWNVLQTTFTFNTAYNSFEGEILSLEGNNRYQIKDFLNSGETIEFTVDKSTGAMNFFGGENDGTYWRFKVNDSFVPCYPAGSDIYITSTYVYLGASYSYLNLNNKNGRIYLWVNYSDSTSGWNALNISWK